MLLQLRLRRALLSSRVGLLQLLVPPRASAIREPSACTPKINAQNPLFKLLIQVELLRGKLEQANNKNDILRENYEMLDTKLTQREEKAAADARLIAQLQNEERRLKEELELTKV